MDRKEILKRRIVDELATPFYIIKNPFKTFEKIKEKTLGNYYLACFLLFMLGVMNIVEYQYTGFILNTFNQANINSLIIMITSLLPIVIFVFANLSLTTFFNGKGNLGEIFKITTYSLFPYLICKLMSIILSNFITVPESSFVKTIYISGLIWSFITLFVGLTVIHEYGLFKNIFSLLLTAVSMMVIIFISLLLINLTQQILGFGESIIKEIIFRLRGY